MFRSAALLALCLLSTEAYMQAFVVREAKGPDAPFLSRELGGKNHVAPQNAIKNEGLNIDMPPEPLAGPKPLARKAPPAMPAPEPPRSSSDMIAASDIQSLVPGAFSALKPGQIIVSREREDGKFNYIKTGSKFSTQSIFMDPPQRAAWSVTPEQHGPARGWSGKEIADKCFPVEI
jgi:hypothetical protein